MSEEIGRAFEHLAEAIRRVYEAERPKTAAEWMDGAEIELSRWHVTMDARPCPNCGGADGFILSVGEGSAESWDGKPYTITPEKRIMLAIFEHASGEVMRTVMSAEQAKQLVNRLGTAISVAETIDAREMRR